MVLGHPESPQEYIELCNTLRKIIIVVVFSKYDLFPNYLTITLIFFI